uniref:Uncharacterized protein n=1 Tax=Romanomermis culicivorax TaxID=13658 RepID=A0A915ID71_ROMCU
MQPRMWPKTHRADWAVSRNRRSIRPNISIAMSILEICVTAISCV